jgi:WD40 repeat protein
MRIFKLKERISISLDVKSHDFPVRNLLFNSSFNQVVSGCNGGIVNVWDPFTGAKTFRIPNLHGTSEITAMSFDSLGRRLITGGRGLLDFFKSIDGTIKVWNFNNGQLIQELVKDDDNEVTDIHVF